MSPGINQEQTARTKARYDRQASRYDHQVRLLDRLGAARWRRRLWAQAQGRVLELGVGTGANFPYYPPGTPVIAIDLSDRLLEQARRKVSAAVNAIELRVMDAQALDFPDATFDTVAATWVFCSVPDPILGLREAWRVLKPGGRLLLLEHVRLGGLLGFIMDLLNPTMVRLTGANINRDTVGNVRRAGFQIEGVETYVLGLVKLIRARRD